MPAKAKTVKGKKPRNLRDLKPTKEAKGGLRKSSGGNSSGTIYV